MSKSRNIADLLDSSGDVKSGALDNVPASDDASSLTTGTIPIARIADDAVVADKLANSINTDIATGVTANTTANAALPRTGGGSYPMTGHLRHGDNVKGIYGDGVDLQIYHDGSHSYIDNAGAGNLHLRGNGTDDIKIQAKNGEQGIIVNADNSVDLYYDNSKKLATTSTGVDVTGDLSVSGSISGAGKVLQVVQEHITATSSQTTSSDTPTNLTGLDATITPASTSSKILVMIRWNGTPGGGNRWETVFGIHRDSTVIGIATAGDRRAGIVGGANLMNNSWTGGDGMYGVAYSYLDSPNTTSATTYRAYINVETGGTCYQNRSSNDTDAGYIERGTSSVILMEIGA